MANCQAFCYFRAKIAVKRGLTISRRIFCHPPEAFCCFRAKTSNIHGKVIVVFVCESFIKTSVVHSLLFFAPKHLSSAGCVLLFTRQYLCRPLQALYCFGTKKLLVFHLVSSPSSSTSFKTSNCSFKGTKCFTFSVVSHPLIRNTISKNVHGNRGAILTTHSMEEADALCSRVGIMVKGQLK